jgi:hypothetical protein
VADGELTWRWARRILGVIGFVYLLLIEAATQVELPLALYALVAALLGLDYIVDVKKRINGDG